MKTKLFFSAFLVAMVNLVSIAQTTTCDDFSDPSWEAIEDAEIVGYTQDGTYPIETTDDWHSFTSGQGYWTGELIFNFSGDEQEVMFTLLDYCSWDGVSIEVNGATTVLLAGSFPIDIDGFSIDKTDIPSDEGSKAELSISGEISSISVNGCETIIESLCIVGDEDEDDDEDDDEEDLTTTCDEFSSESWEALDGEDIVGYTQDGTYPIETTDAWSSFSSGQGYWTGELIFNFSGMEQEATFTLLDYCDWDGVSIVINGTTTVPLIGSFPTDVDGFTIDKTIVPSDEGSRAEIFVSGEISTITIKGCETIVEKLCVTAEDEDVDNSSITENQSFELTVYPNPATDQTNISSPKLISSITLYNMSGKLIQTHIVQAKTTEIDLSKLQTGMYLVYVNTIDGLSGVQKLIIE